MNHLDEFKNIDHPWAQFLYARGQCIVWMKNQFLRSDEEIAQFLSMDEIQVKLIRMHVEDYNGQIQE